MISTRTRLSWILIITLVQLFSTSGFIDCKTACKECRLGNESLDLLEVYCSMCKECRDARRLRTGMARKIIRGTTEAPTVPTTTAAVVKLNKKKTGDAGYLSDWPENCPTAPPCSEEETPKYERLTEAQSKPTTPSTTRPPTTTCPPVPSCKPRKTTMSCVPCMPMCVMPCYDQHATQQMKSFQLNGQFNMKGSYQRGWQNNGGNNNDYGNNNNGNNPNNELELDRLVDGKVTPDYYYLYLGVPKNALGDVQSNDMAFRKRKVK